MKNENKICVKVYFNKDTFQAVALDAEKAGKRRGGLLLFTAKEHGFENEKISNTDGISRFLKHCWGYWRDHEKERLEQAAALAERERALQAEKRKLGIE